MKHPRVLKQMAFLGFILLAFILLAITAGVARVANRYVGTDSVDGERGF